MVKVQIHEVREDVPDIGGRTPSGIPGLDELCEGGFERNSTVLVAGGAGSGKSIFLTQFIYSGAAFYDEPGIFLSLEEPKEKIRIHAKRFGWDLQAMEHEGRLAILNYKPHEVRKLSEEGGGLIWDTITEIGARRIAIDSLSSYVVLFGNIYEAREAQLDLFEMVRKWKCTTLFSGESIADNSNETKFGMEYLTDSVIGLHHQKQDNSRTRSLEIFKMRGTNHSSKICPFDILPKEGLVVYPKEEVFGQD